MEKNLDIVVYGATGFTGKLCAKYLSENSVDLNWAIAGREIGRVKKRALSRC